MREGPGRTLRTPSPTLSVVLSVLCVLGGKTVPVTKRGRPPDQQLAALEVGEGAGVGMGDGADQIVAAEVGPAPVDPAVVRAAAAEVAALGDVLRSPRGFS